MAVNPVCNTWQEVTQPSLYCSNKLQALVAMGDLRTQQSATTGKLWQPCAVHTLSACVLRLCLLKHVKQKGSYWTLVSFAPQLTRVPKRVTLTTTGQSNAPRREWAFVVHYHDLQDDLRKNEKLMCSRRKLNWVNLCDMLHTHV